MKLPQSYQGIVVSIVVVVVVGYVLYRVALPRPLPGIPYNSKSAQRLLGDIPELKRWADKLEGMFGYFPWLANETSSPIIQIFLRPLGRPWVIVVDPRESHDIMIRRHAEFDRSNFSRDIMEAMAPNFHAILPTGKEWTSHRRLIGDTMGSTFLHQVAGRQMLEVAHDVIALWKTKARLARGRSFEVREDVKKATLDIIWAGTFGSATGTVRAQYELLNGMDKLDDGPVDENSAVEFPQAPDPQACVSILTVMNSIRIPTSSLVPKLHHWFALKFYPSLVKAGAHTNQLIRSALENARRRIALQEKASAEDNESTAGLTCAVDLVVSKELKMAQKEGREPNFVSEIMRDELFGFMLGGFETSSINICWGIKFLIKHQDAQEKLRKALESSFQRGRDLTIEDITKTDIPYLDAVIAEVLRCSIGALAAIRVATVDTEILGYAIPKGTDVFFMNNGPGKLMPPIDVPESKRSQSSREAKGRIGSWDPEDISSFQPERWLVKDGEAVRFDSLAGHSHPFGAGKRACFGRRWALLEMRILFVLTFWNFELLPTPEALSSWKIGEHNHTEQMYFKLKVL